MKEKKTYSRILYIRLIPIFIIINLILLKFYLENHRVQEIRRLEEEENRRLEEEESNRDITGFEKFMIYLKLTFSLDMLLKILLVFNIYSGDRDQRQQFFTYAFITLGIYCFSLLIFLLQIKKSSILYKTFQIIDYKYIILIALVSYFVVSSIKPKYLPIPIPLPLLIPIIFVRSKK